MKSHPIKLRDIIGDELLMEEKGWKIIQKLIDGFRELLQCRVSLRSIQPRNTYFSEDFQSMVFSDLTFAYEFGEKIKDNLLLYPPYNPSSFAAF